MAEEIANYLSTPEGYATQDQLAAVRSYAKALLQGEGQQPVQHWAQGVSNMVNALMGGLLLNKNHERELASHGYDKEAVLNNIPKQNYKQAEVAPPVAAPGAPVRKMSAEGEMPKAIPASAPGNDLLAPQKAGIHAVESAVKGYDELGPVIKNPKSAYYGDRAYGKYQVMGRNIPEWTKEALGVSMTPDQFMRDRAAQEKVFEHKFAQFKKQYGSDQDAASVWFTGRPLAKGGAQASDGYISGEEYVRRFNKGMQKAAPTATAFTGEPTPSQAPAVQAMAAALRGGAPEAPAQVEQVAGKGGGVGGTAPAPGAVTPGAVTPVAPQQGAPALIDPRLVKPPPEYSREALGAILQSTWLPQEVKDRAYGMAIQQGQAIRMPVPGGTVLIDPRNPGVQQFIPEVHWGTQEKEIGPIKSKTPIPQVVSPFGGASGGGGVMTLPNIGPRSDAGPAAAPAAAPLGTPEATPASAVAGAQNVRAGTTAPANGVQVASLDPAAGMAQAAAAAEGADKPPVVKVAANEEAANKALSGLDRAPPGVDPADWAAYRQLKQSDAQTEVQKDSEIKAGEQAMKKYDNMSSQAQAARKQIPDIDLALSLMNDKNFNSGLLSGAFDQWNRLKTLVLGDRYANAANETFDKLMAGQVLNTMKSTLAGLGQVRLAEIDLLNRANANRHNTDASNRAVLEITRRGLDKIDKIDGMAQSYVSGDEVVDPITGKQLLKANLDRNGEIQPRRGLDVGFDKLVRKFTNDNPSFTPDEIKRYETIFDTGTDPTAGRPGVPNKTMPQGSNGGPAAIPPAAVAKLPKDGSPVTFPNGRTFKLENGQAVEVVKPPVSK